MAAMPPSVVSCPACGEEIELPTRAVTDRATLPARATVEIDTRLIREHVATHADAPPADQPSPRSPHMPTFRLVQRACDFDLPPEKTVTAACIHRDDDFVRFHDADHELVYAVQRSLLLAMERVDQDQDACAVAEPDQTPEPDELQPRYIEVCVDGSAIFDAVRRAQRISRRPLDGS